MRRHYWRSTRIVHAERLARAVTHLEVVARIANLVYVGQRSSIVGCPCLGQAELLDLLKLHLSRQNKNTNTLTSIFVFIPNSLTQSDDCVRLVANGTGGLVPIRDWLPLWLQNWLNPETENMSITIYYLVVPMPFSEPLFESVACIDTFESVWNTISISRPSV